MAYQTFERNGYEENLMDEFIHDPKIRFYFNQLDVLGDITEACPTKNLDKTNVGLVKVGAKPLSGIRGLYFTKGMWKVKFLDNDYEVITCIFRYHDKETLVKSYHIAHSFLKKVIMYKRHIHEDDGTILEELNDYQLVELDERKSKENGINKLRQFRQSETRYRRSPPEEKNNYRKTIHDSFERSESLDSLYEREKKKKKRKKSNGSININLVKSPGMKEKPRKLTKFESKFLKYCDYSTIDMINHIMDQNRESRLMDHGKTFTLKHGLYDINPRESDGEYNDVCTNGYMFPYLNGENLQRRFGQQNVTETREFWTAVREPGTVKNQNALTRKVIERISQENHKRIEGRGQPSKESYKFDY
ncbi:conserved hypothetical protein [Theileria orientalis strain Shintoku]|uniref:Uncharacterized protein n=1 Tax=Theileria orientalis strain Shintoku TaxID=869250 RepID=J4CCW6_THEOR|nr:conserved hypothetical protein [Theileria orientalis strain Shintoku]PVC51148.1 hypothetical protein MACL_00001733 [Theileria orientalis]BAM40107.1 conserved hypothetical protein [Theileria orientalis strain Shintoku]|eukprot:XP_009690408.1 conserved hypothetical protein [Theileria orientalis strain Shintoku]